MQLKNKLCTLHLQQTPEALLHMTRAAQIRLGQIKSSALFVSRQQAGPHKPGGVVFWAPIAGPAPRHTSLNLTLQIFSGLCAFWSSCACCSTAQNCTHPWTWHCTLHNCRAPLTTLCRGEGGFLLASPLTSSSACCNWCTLSCESSVMFHKRLKSALVALTDITINVSHRHQTNLAFFQFILTKAGNDIIFWVVKFS